MKKHCSSSLAWMVAALDLSECGAPAKVSPWPCWNHPIYQLLCVAITVFAPLALADEAPIKVVGTPPGKPPADAFVLYDGSSTDAFLGVEGKPCTWESKDGILTVGRGFIVSKLHFRDAQIDVEFMVPTEQAGNSGVYIHGHYEMQISDTAGSTRPDKEMIGSLYRFAPPLVNAGRKAHEWQVYDIVFRAPRYNQRGKIEIPGSITAFLNGVLVQNGTTFTEPRSPYTPYVYKNTPYTASILESLKKTDAGPLYLQDHQSPVKFRSVWVRPLDDRAKIFE
jgi:hypothetical protein